MELRLSLQGPENVTAISYRVYLFVFQSGILYRDSDQLALEFVGVFH